MGAGTAVGVTGAGLGPGVDVGVGLGPVDAAGLEVALGIDDGEADGDADGDIDGFGLGLSFGNAAEGAADVVQSATAVFPCGMVSDGAVRRIATTFIAVSVPVPPGSGCPGGGLVDV